MCKEMDIIEMDRVRTSVPGGDYSK